MTTAVEVTYGGKSRPLLEWITGKPAATGGARANVRDIVNTAGSVCLAPHFADDAPEYPTFAVLITSANRPQAAADALRWIRGLTKTQQATAVLDALELLDGDRLDSARSRYAAYIVDALKRKGHGQVLNRSELIQDDYGVEYMAPALYRLEPEWVVVALAALVYNGDVVLAIPGKKLDANSLDMLATTPMAELVNFKHVEQPREWNLPALKALFELLGLTPGMAQLVTQGKDEPVQELQKAVGQTVEQVVLAQQHLQGGLPFWGRPLIDEGEQGAYRAKLDGAKTFLESLQPYTSPGKLKNFRHDTAEVRAQAANLDALRDLATLHGLVADLSAATAYLAQARLALPTDHPWVERMQERQGDLLAAMNAPAKRNAAGFRQGALAGLDELKRDYITAYSGLHAKARLNMGEDKRKVTLMRDPRLEQLKRLATIELIPASALTDLQNRLAALKSCFNLTEQELQATPLCPHCHFNPATEPVSAPAGGVLTAIDDEMDTLLASWTRTLLENVEDPTTSASLDLLSTEHRCQIDRFLATRELPDTLDAGFIQAAQEALSGLSKVVVTADSLRAALLDGGSPATTSELKTRFDGYLSTTPR